MDKDEIINKVKLFAKEASREFNIKKIILYGSFVNGNFTDVAIVLDDLPEDILNSEFKLYKMRRDIDHRIEPVIFAYGKDKSGFLEELLRTGLEIYPAA